VKDDSKPCSHDHVIALAPPNERGEQRVLRARADGRVCAGALVPMRDGRPFPAGAEVVQLSDAKGRTAHATTLYTAPSPAAARGGPAKVATTAYREGWDQVFGTKEAPPGAAN
jgi:hypothetical protein